MNKLIGLLPEFCVIAPVAYLSDFCAQTTRHLVLAHLVDTNDAYASFYNNLQHDDREHYIIMDNGAFELGESYDPAKLIQLATKCGADAIVLPDYPFKSAQVTIDASKALISRVKDAGYHTFFCPQSETGQWQDWVRGYRWGAENDDIDIIGMSILGIPNALPHLPAAYARVVATELLRDYGVFNFAKYHHYLGLNAGPALEIPPLLEMNALDSCDSSGPVWAGILGHEYTRNADSYQSVRKIKQHVDFDIARYQDEERDRRIQANLDLTFELFGS